MVASSISLSPTPSPTSALSIAGRAGHAFTPQAMLQGFVCHARGVELPASGPARVHARVRSKRTHDVHLRAEQGRLVVACSCPARSFGLDVCKHVWAALLEVDRHDALGDLRKARGPITIVPAPPAPAPPAKTEPAKTEPAKAEPERDASPNGGDGGDARAARPAREKAAARKRATEPESKPAPRPKALAKTAAPAKKASAEKAPSTTHESKKAPPTTRAARKARPRPAKRR